MNRKLFIGNLPFAATEYYLRELFEESGHTVEEVRIMTDQETGRSRGFAFVTLGENTDIEKVIGATNGQSFMGRRLTVNAATPKDIGNEGVGRRSADALRRQERRSRNS